LAALPEVTKLNLQDGWGAGARVGARVSMMWVCPGRLTSEVAEVGGPVKSCTQSSQRRAQMKNHHLDSELLLSDKSTFSIFEMTWSWRHWPPCRGTAFLALGTVGTPRALLEDTHLTTQECLAVLKVSKESGFQYTCCFLLF